MSGSAPERERLRFEHFEMKSFQDGRCSAHVVLEWWGDERYEGAADGTETLHGRLRAAALACLKAAEEATNHELGLALRGVKAVRAFDAWVVIVSVQGGSGPNSHRLLGAATSPDDEEVARSAAQAVLDATNRVLQRYLTSP